MSNCPVSNQIAKHCDGPEAVECPRCRSSMTENSFLKHKYLKCDNTVCAIVIELKGNDDE